MAAAIVSRSLFEQPAKIGTFPNRTATSFAATLSSVLGFRGHATRARSER
jgi:hypothetical protein